MRALIWRFYDDLKAVSRRTHRAAPWRTACPLRSHLPSTHRLRHARSPARAAARQQAGVADGARSPGDTAPHQWLRARHPSPCHQAQGQWWHAQSRWPRLPRRIPRIDAHRRQTRHSRSGTILATASAFLASRSFHTCQTSSAVADSPPEARTPGVLPLLPSPKITGRTCLAFKPPVPFPPARDAGVMVRGSGHGHPVPRDTPASGGPARGRVRAGIPRRRCRCRAGRRTPGAPRSCPPARSP